MPCDLRPIAITLLLAGAAFAQPISGFRTWTDATGKHKVEAKLITFEYDQVTLEKADGRMITLPLDRLSDADREALRASTVRPKAPAVVGPSIADWSTVRNLSLDPPETWSLAPETPVEVKQRLTRGAVPLGPPVGGKPSIFESVVVIGFIHEQGQAIVARTLAPPAVKKTVWIERCDLVKGRSLGAFELPPDVMALDIDPTGQRLVVRSNVFGFGNNGRIDVFDMDGLEPTLIASFEPYADAKRSAKDVSYAAFVDADHLLTCGNGSITLWHLPTVSALYTLPVNQPPTISGQRKYLAVPTNNDMYVLDAATGKTLAQLQGERGGHMKFAFRPDAKRLAMVSHGRVQVWDCEKGERYCDIFLQGVGIANELTWVGDEYVLVGKSHVVDIESRIVLWKYDGLGPGEMFGGKYWSVVGGGPHGKSMLPIELPHEEAVQAVAAIPPETLLAVQPGTRMRLEVLLGFTPQRQQQVKDALAARLRENGIVLDDAATLVFKAEAYHGEKKSITYEGFGFRGGSSTVEVTLNKYSMAIQDNGQDIWRTGSVTGAPPILHLQQGETVQQAVAKFSELNPAFFLKTPLPRLLARPGKYGGAYGVSRVTATGLQTTQRP